VQAISIEWNILALDDEVVGVQPEPRERFSRDRLRCADFVLDAGNAKSIAGDVNVEVSPRYFMAIAETLDVPDGRPSPIGSFQSASYPFRFPEDEITGVGFVVSHGRTRAQAGCR